MCVCVMLQHPVVYKREVCAGLWMCVCSVSQITNVILVVSAEDVHVYVCMCVSVSHITNIILLVGSGDVCENVCHRN